MINKILTLTGVMLATTVLPTLADSNLRPPAVPLIANDPYLSVWSGADKLTDATTRHWTRTEHPLVSLLRIDGKAYRLMGTTPSDTPAFPQTGLKVTPTRSIYDFDDGHVHVTMTFMTPSLPTDLDVLARPVTYITWDAKSSDGATHNVSIYDSTSSLLSVNTPEQSITWSREPVHGLTALKAGTAAQTYFRPAGDGVRINWGYIYAVAPSAQSKAAIGGDAGLAASFVTHGSLPTQDDTRLPRMASDDTPSLALTFDLGNVTSAPVSRHMIVAYDEVYAINWFRKKLRPYWRRNGATPAQMLTDAERDYPSLIKRCVQFDDNLMADMTRVGGNQYAQICALAYRQCIAACGLVADSNGKPFFLTKENTSNGDIATVDVIFPMDPMVIFLSPTLAKATLAPLFAYAASPHWKFPNAPHDLGTYPVANGRDDGGEQMPVEESGNMIILADAIAQQDGNADFIKPWWPQITQWAKFLEQYGLDPENQLCTDDFMGHLAHNANLSVKAIIALAAYGDLCKMRGDTANAQRYAGLAKDDAAHWMSVADAGDHSLLAFDKPGTWSQKYNLVWDQILGLNVFPVSVRQREVAYYKSKMQPYGVPLDSRTKLTKADWSFWSATLADSQADFETIVAPTYDYLNTTTTRDPISDSYMTDNVKSGGMHARPVVGGLFIKMLTDRAVWKKWASMDTAHVSGWAEVPAAPVITPIVPTSEYAAQTWRYSTTKPTSDDWTKPSFDDSSWPQGPGGFGAKGTPGAVVGTDWQTSDIWMRRSFTMPAGSFHNLQFSVYHDEDVEIYVNGVLAGQEGGYVGNYVPIEITPAALALLKSGTTITLAVHCHQTQGGQGIDVGLADVSEKM